MCDSHDAKSCIVQKKSTADTREGERTMRSTDFGSEVLQSLQSARRVRVSSRALQRRRPPRRVRPDLHSALKNSLCVLHSLPEGQPHPHLANKLHPFMVYCLQAPSIRTRLYLITMASGAGAQIIQTLRKSHAMGPSVRNLLSQYKLDPSQIASTGPHQTLLKGDVLSYLSQRSDNLAASTTNPSPTTPKSSISAPKPITSRSTNSTQYISQTSRYYPRTPLSQWEIDVINGGGAADPPTPPPSSSKGAGTQAKSKR